MDETGDKFTDAIAFARCVMRNDWEGMETILSMQENVLDILVPQSWILNATITKLSQHLGLTIDEVWMIMLQSVEAVAGQVKKEEDES